MKMKKNVISVIALITIITMISALFAPFNSVSLAASSEPDFSSSAYTSENIFYLADASLYGQCTWYAWGRAYEVTGIKLSLNGDASTWYNLAPSYGYTTSSTPRENSIACWSGHVAFVEAVSGDTLTISQANYNWTGEYNGRVDWSTSELESQMGQSFLGYIYVGDSVDTEAPTVSSVEIIEKTDTGYTIKCNVSDNVGVTNVAVFAWVQGVSPAAKEYNVTVSGNEATCTINYADIPGISDANGYTFTTGVYADDAAGNRSLETRAAELYVDLEAPVITNAEITNVTGTTYTVTCTITDNVGVKNVFFPTRYNLTGDEDFEWETVEVTSSGTTYTATVDISDFGGKGGTYDTHIYAYDEYGNHAGIALSTEVYPVTGVTLSETEKELYKGQTLNLTATYVPDNTTEDTTITWASSNEEVATVDENGAVVALSEGETTITAIVGGVKGTCVVTVKEIPLDEIAINEQDITLTVGDNKTLTVLFNPEDTTDDTTIVWTSSDNSIVSISEDGIITAVSVGKAEITATVGDKVATTFVTVTEKTDETSDDTEISEETTGTPKTGDMQVTLLVAGLVISAIGIAYIVKRKFKK